MLASPTAASAKSKPDLRASRATAAAYAHPGGAVRAGARVTATGAKAGRSTLRFYLSANRKRDAHDLRLSGKAATRALKKGRRVTVTATPRVPAGAKPGRYRVLACADDLRRVREKSEKNNCAAAAAVTTVTARPMGAGNLIAADLAKGRISKERALVLRVEALFGDKRLPAKYAGDQDAPADDAIMREAADTFATLSSPARRIIGPYLLPPAARGSWLSSKKKARAAAGDDDPCDSRQVADPGWESVSAAGGRLRFWFKDGDPADKKAAQGYADAVGDTAYPRFKQLFGRDLPSDAGAQCYHGSDGATDVYIVPKIAGRLLGVTMPSEQSPANNKICDGTSSFIAVQRGLSRWGVAHELFHAFQFTYPYSEDCGKYLFWDESTATWGAQYAFGNDDDEHAFQSMLDIPEAGFETQSYDGWIFPLFLEHTYGANLIPKTYAAFKTDPPLDGIDAGIGGFATRWRAFTKAGWNRSTVQPSIAQWDHWTEAPGADQGAPLTLGGAKTASVPAPFSLQEITRQYTDYTVSDPKVRDITFRNRAYGHPGEITWAEITLASGAKRVEDWTDRTEVHFCRDTASENVQSITLLRGNGDFGTDSGYLTVAPSPSFDLKDSCNQGIHYKVLSASFGTTTHGNKSVNQYCGAVSGTTVFTGAGAPVTDGTKNALEPEHPGSTALVGELGTHIPAGWDYNVTGCNYNQDPCTAHFSRNPSPNGTWPVWVGIEAASLDAPTAKLTWSIPDPSIGFIDPDESSCLVFEFWKALPDADTTRTIPMSTLLSKNPITLQISGTDAWETDQPGDAAHLDYSWTFTIKVQRID